jgi:fructose-bisphosphate aldolase class II
LDSKDGMKVIVKQRLEEFGTAGNASKIKPKSLSVMSQLYSDDKLSQKIY